LLALKPPVKLELYEGTDQLYKVPAGTTPLVVCVGVIWNRTPSQAIIVISVIAGRGFTVITTEKLLLLLHPFVNEGCIINVTDCALLDVLEKVPVIAALGPANEVHVIDEEAEDALIKL
jgi:hypothetical protein